MAQIRNFTSTNDSYFVLDGVSYPKVYEAMLDNGYTKDRVKLVGTNRDNSPLVFSTHYSNIRVDGASFANAEEAISRLNQVVFSKGGGSGGGGTTGDYIPLSGTEEGKPVTGFIATSAKCGFGYASDGGTEYNLYTYDQGSTTIRTAYLRPDNLTMAVSNLELHTETGESYNGFIGIRVINYRTYIDDGHYDIDNCAGLYSRDDYSNNFPENKLIYAQRSYVDKANSYSTTETKTGGTWIDGKPIYTITKLTADPIPSDIDTRFPDEIIGDYTAYKFTKTTDVTP